MNTPHPYQCWLKHFHCNSLQGLYIVLEFTAKNKMGLDGVPFSLSALENPPGNQQCPDIQTFILQCIKALGGDNSDDHAINLIKFLKENPPKESFENPKWPDSEPTQDDKNLMQHIFTFGIDLPGSKHNPFGHLQYFSSFFIDMYFGNYTEFNDHVKSLSKKDLKKAMKKREGYCQFSPIFAPILGWKLAKMDSQYHPFTDEEKKKIRTMYNLKNENKHLQILLKLIKFKVDVNANDINGYTPLHYAVLNGHEEMVKALLRHGANPNQESRDRRVPLNLMVLAIDNDKMRIIDILIQYNANLILKNDNDKDKTRITINEFRSNVEAHGSLDLAVRVRESHPRDKEECEKCAQPAVKKCSACSLVYYCTPACQKLDWKFHKVTCQKSKHEFQ